jgi:hypothetical protein
MNLPKILAFVEQRFEPTDEYGFNLKNAFGPNMMKHIIWFYSPNNMEQRIGEFSPHLILTFGSEVERQIDNSLLAISIDYLCGPPVVGKPASLLAQFAVEVESWCNDWKVKEPLLSGNWEAFRTSIQPEIDKKLPPKAYFTSGRIEDDYD